MIRVERKSDDGLSMREWSFLPLLDGEGLRVRLQGYSGWIRKTKRHKFVVYNWWHRYDVRRSTLRAEEVAIPDDVREQVLSEMRSMIEVSGAVDE